MLNCSFSFYRRCQILLYAQINLKTDGRYINSNTRPQCSWSTVVYFCAFVFAACCLAPFSIHHWSERMASAPTIGWYSIPRTSTCRAQPSSKLTLGLYPSNFFALRMANQKRVPNEGPVSTHLATIVPLLCVHCPPSVPTKKGRFACEPVLDLAEERSDISKDDWHMDVSLSIIP